MKNKFISIISPQYGTAGTDLNYYKIAHNLSFKSIKPLFVTEEIKIKRTSFGIFFDISFKLFKVVFELFSATSIL